MKRKKTSFKPKLKLLLVLITSLVLFFLPRLLLTGLIFLTVLLLVASFGKLGEFIAWGKFLLVVAGLIIALQTFTYSGLGFQLTGFIFGVKMSLRLLSLFLVVFSFIKTTPVAELVAIFDFMPEKVQLMIALMFRMIPQVKTEIGRIKNAQAARGVNFRSLNVIKTYLPVLIPLLRGSIEHSEHLALSLEARGVQFGAED